MQLKLRPPYRMVSQDRLADPAIDDGATPLLRAAKAADVPAMQALLAAGALVDLPNVYGQTPLIVAAGATRGRATPTRGGNYTEDQAIEAVKLLLAAGADVNAAAYKRADSPARCGRAAARATWSSRIATRARRPCTARLCMAGRSWRRCSRRPVQISMRRMRTA